MTRLAGAFVVGCGLALLVAACGGDDTSSFAPAPPPPPPPAGTAEGVYGGTLTGAVSSAFMGLVLENDDLWALYGQDSGSVFTVFGFIQGPGTSSNGNYTSPNARDFGFVPAIESPIVATYNSTARTITGTVMGSSSAQFSGGPIPGSLYDYSTAASLGSISGHWELLSTNIGAVTADIAADGHLTTLSEGCSGSGTIAPRPSGRNVFNISLTFGSAPCLLPGQTVTGIGVSYPLATGQRQLIGVVVNEARTNGTAVFGVR